jgi:hypothetical protein
MFPRATAPATRPDPWAGTGPGAGMGNDSALGAGGGLDRGGGGHVGQGGEGLVSRLGTAIGVEGPAWAASAAPREIRPHLGPWCQVGLARGPRSVFSPRRERGQFRCIQLGRTRVGPAACGGSPAAAGSARHLEGAGGVEAPGVRRGRCRCGGGSLRSVGRAARGTRPGLRRWRRRSAGSALGTARPGRPGITRRRGQRDGAGAVGTR